MSDIMLSPAWATGLFVLACLAGTRFRNVWKNEGPRWQLWLTGVTAGVCLLVVALVPLAA